MATVRIETLPEELTADDAVGIAYGADLSWIEQKVRAGLSVLVECDKQVTLWLYRALRDRLRQPTNGQPMTCRLLSGRPREGERGGSVIGNVLGELADAVTAAEPGTVIVMPHLDILTTTTKSALTDAAREAIARFYENPDAVILGFKDPSFELPKVIEDVFTAKRSLLGTPRDILSRLVLRREARKFGVDEFDPYSLYKFVSGLNAIKLRRILEHFQSRLDFDPANPSTRAQLLRDVREMTLVGDMEIPRVDLHKDIGGYLSVKNKIETEILTLLTKKDTLQDDEQIRALEGLIPRGIIFSGPPGTGKTFFAKAFATSIDATCIVVSGPELKSKWYGESEENLRRVFARARKAAPAVIVFDELDSFATARGMYANTSGVDHSLVNQLLTEMDGFRKEELVFVVGTTNFVESLDPALLRPGRFEFQIDIAYPIDDDRRDICDIYRSKFDLDMSDEVRDHTVRRTGGVLDREKGTQWAGDHIQALFRALKREEIRRGGKAHFKVTAEEVDRGVEKIVGPKQKIVFTPEEERTIAIHESGHALCAMLLPNATPMEKITIATGESDILGAVMNDVRKNRYVTTRADMIDDIAVCLGGRVAEKLRCGEVSQGAWNDLRQANDLARYMMEELGMADDLLPRTFSPSHRQDPIQRRPVSPERAKLVDDAIDKLLREQHERVTRLLSDNSDLLDALTARIMEKKTMTKQEVADLIADHKLKNAKVGVV